jgi:hypothetical protein
MWPILFVLAAVCAALIWHLHTNPSAKSFLDAEHVPTNENVLGLPRNSRNNNITSFDGWVESYGPKVADEWFFVRVSGVSYDNEDGSDRQLLISKAKQFDSIMLVADPTNIFDKNAIAVMSEAGAQFGFLPSHTAQEVARNLRKGMRYASVVSGIGIPTGGKFLGMVIVLFRLKM